MNARELVEAFAQLTSQCLDALVARYVGLERPTVWTGLFLQPRDGGEPVRSGVLDGLGAFRLHGRGCQFELESGADVDVDWDKEGRAVFDSWRVMMYARSIGAVSVDQGSLREAALDVATIVAIGPDTFTWPNRRYDLALGDAGCGSIILTSSGARSRAAKAAESSPERPQAWSLRPDRSRRLTMATVHVREIMKWLAASGHDDAEPWSSGYFFEIRFDEAGSPVTQDAEFADRVITVDAPQGTVTITVDEHGQLQSLDIS